MFAALTKVRPAVTPRVLEPEPVHEDGEAVAYEAMIERHAWILNRPFVNFVTRTKGRCLRVLDIGTGPGWVPIEIAKRRDDWHLTGLDASASMLQLARRRAKAAGVARRVSFINGNAAELPFDDGAFDLVISNYLLHHLPNPAALLNEARRVCATDGGVCIKDLRRLPMWHAAINLKVSQSILRYSPSQMNMYRESLAAALTLAEARACLAESTLPGGHVRSFLTNDYIIKAGPRFGLPSF